jgi:hypothetical protein
MALRFVALELVIFKNKPRVWLVEQYLLKLYIKEFYICGLSGGE